MPSKKLKKDLKEDFKPIILEKKESNKNSEEVQTQKIKKSTQKKSQDEDSEEVDT